MDTAARNRWDELAGLVAARSERDDPGLDLAALLLPLEAAVGVTVLAGPDPAPIVSARRFARVHAAASRSGRLTSRPALSLVERAITSLANDREAPGHGSDVGHGPAPVAAAGPALSGLDPPPGPRLVGSRPHAGSLRR